MFKKLKNIDTAFRQSKLVAMAAIAGSVLCTCCVCYFSFLQVQKAQQKVYLLLSNGKILEALGAERGGNVAVEARDHVGTFHEFFFTLSPDEKAIESNIRRALYLADESAKQQYDNLKEANYYGNIISANISQKLIIDSIGVDMTRQPYQFVLKATQILTRPTSVVRRSLITSGQLREVEQSDNNPHGFLIERWKIVENKDIDQEIR